MKRNQIKISNEEIIKYCKREHAMQNKVFPKRIEEGKMQQYEANKYYCIITEYQELAKSLELKGYKWQELKGIINSLPGRRTAAQQQALNL